jgi:predicted aminopeptidase
MAIAGFAGLVALAAATVCLASGCSTLGYYAHSVGGHLDLLRSARPVPNWMADDSAPTALKERLALTQRIRDYAVSELKEPDNASYRRYADLHRNAAVWNVVAAPELSLKLKTWCFPVVGCVGYRGYYDQAAANAEGQSLREQGFEVTVYPVPAYSTLGKMEWLGGERWMAAHGSDASRAQAKAIEQRRSDFRRLTLGARAGLDALYRSDASDEAKRARKAELMAQMRADYAALKAGAWNGYAGYDAFFANANNASLGIQAAYLNWVPAFTALFEREGRDFPRFYAAAQRLAGLPRAERDAALQGLAPPATESHEQH